MTVNIYACNACHLIFHADEQPLLCPDCKAKTVVGKTETGRRMNIPAIRPATEAEGLGECQSGEGNPDREGFSGTHRQLGWIQAVDAFQKSLDRKSVV